jgi:hypothetical protein
MTISLLFSAFKLLLILIAAYIEVYMEDIALTSRIVSSVFYNMEFHFHKSLSRTAGNALFDNLCFLTPQFLITIKNDMACRGQITVKGKS